MKRLASLFLLSFIVLEVHSGVARGQWVEASNGLIANSNPGIRTLTIDLSGSTLYATSASQSVFKSDDGGATWRLLGGISGVVCLGIDPKSPSTVYAGTSHGIRSSRDGGESWSGAGLREKSVSALAVDPMTPSNVYAVAGETVYKSTDSGTTWTALNLQFHSEFANFMGAIQLDPANPSTVYVSGGYSALYKSTDGGESWAVANGGHFSWAEAAPDPGVLYAMRLESGLSKSMDGGMTWSAINFGPPATTLTIDPSNAAVLYAATSGPALSGQAIYKSTDSGQSWSLVNTTIPVAASLSVDPANSSGIFALSYDGRFFKSADAGSTWSNPTASLRLFDIEALAPDTANPSNIYAGGESGLFKSSDGGTTWEAVAAFQLAMGFPPPGQPAPVVPLPGAGPAAVRSILIDARNPGTLYVGSRRPDGCFFADRDFFKSTDGGAVWSNSISPDNTGCLTDGTLIADPSNPATLYMPLGDAYDYGGYWLKKSTDGGGTWGDAGLYTEDFHSLAVDPVNSANLYAATGSGVLSSNDGGDHWNTVLPQGNVSLLAIDPTHPAVIYAASATGMLKTTDAGVTWSRIGSNLDDILAVASTSALLIDPVQPNVLYLGTAGYGVFKSADSGVTWTPLNDGLTQLNIRAMAFLHGDSTTLFVGTPGGVFKLVQGALTPAHRVHRGD